MITKINKIILVQIVVQVKALFKIQSTIGRLAIVISIKIKGAQQFSMINQKFLCYAYQIVYVGAISILFIFTIKLVVNKLSWGSGINQQDDSNNTSISIRSNPEGGPFVASLLLLKQFSKKKKRINKVAAYEKFEKDWSNIQKGLNDIKALSLSLYEIHWLIKILQGVLLFGVLVGKLMAAKTIRG